MILGKKVRDEKKKKKRKQRSAQKKKSSSPCSLSLPSSPLPSVGLVDLLVEVVVVGLVELRLFVRQHLFIFSLYIFAELCG